MENLTCTIENCDKQEFLDKKKKTNKFYCSHTIYFISFFFYDNSIYLSIYKYVMCTHYNCCYNVNMQREIITSMTDL